MEPVSNVPTNIITGALGVGKTTLIQTMLEQKPADERWAVLVNEFGEVGIDGALLSGSQKGEVFIREVPGGCMCCTSGLPMQIALNMLLASARPHRLLIEPTGLGHPKEVLQTLTATHYQDVLDMRATLTLVDPRKLADQRWCDHQTFREQIQVADQIIATKFDLYGEALIPNLTQYMSELGVAETPLERSENGTIDIALLNTPSKFNPSAEAHDHVHQHSAQISNMGVLTAPVSGSIKIANSGEGYYSYGWVCSANEVFDYQIAIDTFASLSIERLKAVLLTDRGAFGFNLNDGTLRTNQLDKALDSRLEFITRDSWQASQACKIVESTFGLAAD